MTDGDHGRDHSPVSGDGEHASEHAPDSERGHDHAESDGADEHADAEIEDADDHHASDVSAYGAAVLTVSSSRDLESDASGDAIAAALEAEGGTVVTRELVTDDFDRVQGAVANLTRRDDVDVVVTTGGTGVAPDDVTPDAIESLLAKRLPGFGETFRRRSIDEVGNVGMLSRAFAGVSKETLVVSLPGSESAAETGVELLTDVLGHVLGLVTDDDAGAVDDEGAVEDVGDGNDRGVEGNDRDMHGNDRDGDGEDPDADASDSDGSGDA